MNSSIEKVPLSKLIKPVLGGTPSRSKSEYWGGDILWASAKDIANNGTRHLNTTDEHITKVGYKNSNVKLMPEGTVVITARGTVGALVQLGVPMTFNQTCYGLIPQNRNILNNDYLYYAVKGALSQIKSISYGAVFDTITMQSFDSLFIPLPPLPMQRKIVDILGSLDDKIEVNQQINQTLEQMAQTLYKNWFVDFGPFLEGEFCASELGEIPLSWIVGKVDDLGSTLNKSADPQNIPPETPYIGLEHMPRGSVALCEWGTASEVTSNKLQFSEKNILFGKLRPYFKKVGIAPIDGVCSSDILVIMPQKPDFFSMLLCQLIRDEFIDFTNASSGGTRMPRTSWSQMAAYKISIPPDNVIADFDRIVKPWFDQITSNVLEIRKLCDYRNYLHPKLLSGEIEISS